MYCSPEGSPSSHRQASFGYESFDSGRMPRNNHTTTHEAKLSRFSVSCQVSCVLAPTTQPRASCCGSITHGTGHNRHRSNIAPFSPSETLTHGTLPVLSQHVSFVQSRIRQFTGQAQFSEVCGLPSRQLQVRSPFSQHSH